MTHQPTSAIPSRHPRRTTRSTSLRALAVAAHLERTDSTHIRRTHTATPRQREHSDH
jgi:hypothetical protein